MADKNIGALPQAAQLDDSSLLVAEQQGQAVKITGAQFKEFGRQAVVGQVQGYVDQAEAAANRAEGAVRSVEDMTVEAAALPAGQEAAVTKTIRAGKVHLAFGLPRGEQGVPGPEGKQGQRGPKGDPGTGLKILGYYDTLPALEAAAAAPSAGDAYGIGTEPPYSIYVFDGTSHTWKDNGQLSGGGGGILPEHVVTAEGGASIEVPASLGEGPHTITFVDEEEPALTAEDIEYSGGQTVKEAMDGLFTSVSDGKAAVASAITDKGVPTAQDADFSTLADHIRKIASGAETSDATATPGDILSPKTAYTAAGKVEGLIPSLAAQIILPGTADKTIASGQYLRGTQTIRGDTNLTSGNIKKGVTLFGVTGALESSFRATLTVKADIGAVVTAKNGDTEVSALSTTGTVVLELPIEGTWKVTAVRGVAQYNTVTLQVSSQYNAQLTAEVHIEYYGSATSMSHARGMAVCATVGNNLIIGGGKTITKHSVAHVDTYNKNLTHSNLESLLDASGEGAATSTKSYAIFAGGTILNYDRTAKITAYDNDLTRSAPTVLSQARNALAAASIGEYALFAGGQYDRSRIDYSSSEKNARSTVVDAYSNTLTRTTPTDLPVPMGNPAAGANSSYVVIVGQGKTAAYSTSLTRTSTVDPSKAHIKAAQAGNYVVFACDDGTLEAYDLFLTKVTASSMYTARKYFGMTTLQGYALILGGFIAIGTPVTHKTPVEIYDAYLTHTSIDSTGGPKYPAVGTIDHFALSAGGFTTSQLSDHLAGVSVYRHI